MIKKFSVDEDIRKAFTLAKAFYTEPAIFELSKEKVKHITNRFNPAAVRRSRRFDGNKTPKGSPEV